MHVRPIDPRDIQWEDDAPIFRLTFWRKRASPLDVRRELTGCEARELEISGTDVERVLSWARAHAEADESFTLHVVVRCPDLGLGQILIAGSDPTVAWECS